MPDGADRRDKSEHRLRRQFQAIERALPVGGRTVGSLHERRYRPIRIPLAIVFIIGGLLWFLPVFGLWMLPAGLLLLAVDVPAVRPAISAAVIRGRRRFESWRRRYRRPNGS